MSDKDIPEELNQITDVVLAYRPKPKTKAAKKRKRLKTKIEKEAKGGNQPRHTAAP
jgi:hypothetical protein